MLQAIWEHTQKLLVEHISGWRKEAYLLPGEKVSIQHNGQSPDRVQWKNSRKDGTRNTEDDQWVFWAKQSHRVIFFSALISQKKKNVNVNICVWQKLKCWGCSDYYMENFGQIIGSWFAAVVCYLLQCPGSLHTCVDSRFLFRNKLSQCIKVPHWKVFPTGSRLYLSLFLLWTKEKTDKLSQCSFESMFCSAWLRIFLTKLQNVFFREKVFVLGGQNAAV